jgi:hypothetical protein
MQDEEPTTRPPTAFEMMLEQQSGYVNPCQRYNGSRSRSSSGGGSSRSSSILRTITTYINYEPTNHPDGK